ncbi:MAG TPA: alkane 1-monooxygenase [Flavisolibacter sp.]|nr:alkane 1-monooxygenase [Flavisolibacter sp.]
MRIRAFKYTSPFLIYAGALLAFVSTGWVVWLPMIYAWIIIPLVELFIKPDESNLSEAEEELAKKDRVYDYLLYAIVPLQYLALFLFLYSASVNEYTLLDLTGKVMVMGLLCGTFGINVGHELGHRVKKFEQTLAKLLLLSSLYMHFYIEHNKGHHKRVATPSDPSSSRYGETLYLFFFRTIVFSYTDAWRIANADARKKGHPALSLHNEMVRFQLIQILLIAAIFIIFGGWTVLLFFIAAFNGILLLETVNYIEHYGLERKKIDDAKFERTLPQHSWNSNHVIGRVMLFELSRHSDHHYLASRKYQVLRHHCNSPQMPTGYPGMMLLATIPPAWFFVMNKRVKQYR